jgi:hypothetical protein
MTQLASLLAMQERRLLAQERRLIAARNAQAQASVVLREARCAADLLRVQTTRQRAAIDARVLGQLVNRSAVDRAQYALTKLRDALGIAIEKVQVAHGEETRAGEALREVTASYALQASKVENFRALAQEERAQLTEVGLAAEEAEWDDIKGRKCQPATA